MGPLDLTIVEGEFLAIVGPSGCGKSTFLSIIAGLIQPTVGKVTIGETNVTAPYTDLGIVFQKDLLLDWRTVGDNVLLQAYVRGLLVSNYYTKAGQLLDLVGLGGFASHFPRELSGGMRQRVAICRALLLDPPLLLMDEPFAALDALTRDQLAVDFGALWMQRRKTVLLITHSISEAIYLADRVVVMSPRPGRIDLDLRIDLERPRPLEIRESAQFTSYMTTIRKSFEARGVLHGSERHA